MSDIISIGQLFRVQMHLSLLNRAEPMALRLDLKCSNLSRTHLWRFQVELLKCSIGLEVQCLQLKLNNRASFSFEQYSLLISLNFHLKSNQDSMKIELLRMTEQQKTLRVVLLLLKLYFVMVHLNLTQAQVS